MENRLDGGKSDLKEADKKRVAIVKVVLEQTKAWTIAFLVAVETYLRIALGSRSW